MKNYEKTRKIWHQKAVKLSNTLNKKSPEDTLMRSSDTFSEINVLKSGSLMKKGLYAKKLGQRDFDVCTKPHALDTFKDHNIRHPCMRHLRRSAEDIKSIKFLQKIESLKDIMVKGSNKFQSEIEYVRSVPESERYMIQNVENEPKVVNPETSSMASPRPSIYQSELSQL